MIWQRLIWFEIWQRLIWSDMIWERLTSPQRFELQMRDGRNPTDCRRRRFHGIQSISHASNTKKYKERQKRQERQLSQIFRVENILGWSRSTLVRRTARVREDAGQLWLQPTGLSPRRIVSGEETVHIKECKEGQLRNQLWGFRLVAPFCKAKANVKLELL